MVAYAENALEKDAPAASDLAHQEVAGIRCRQLQLTELKHVVVAARLIGPVQQTVKVVLTLKSTVCLHACR